MTQNMLSIHKPLARGSRRAAWVGSCNPTVTSAEEEQQRRGQPHERRAPCWRDHPHPRAIYGRETLETHCFH